MVCFQVWHLYVYLCSTPYTIIRSFKWIFDPTGDINDPNFDWFMNVVEDFVLILTFLKQILSCSILDGWQNSSFIQLFLNLSETMEHVEVLKDQNVSQWGRLDWKKNVVLRSLRYTCIYNKSLNELILKAFLWACKN